MMTENTCIAEKFQFPVKDIGGMDACGFQTLQHMADDNRPGHSHIYFSGSEREEVKMSENYILVQHHLETTTQLVEEMFAQQQRDGMGWNQEKTTLIGDMQALAEKFYSMIKTMGEESTVKENKHQTFSRVQILLTEKEKEITDLKESLCIQMKHNEACKREMEQLKKGKYVYQDMKSSDGSQKKTQNPGDNSTKSEVQYQVSHIQEELRIVENILAVEHEKREKEKQGFFMENEVLMNKNGQLQKQLELIQEKLRMELKEVEKLEKVRQGLVLERETLGKKIGHLQNQLQLYEENLRTTELKHTDKLEKVRHGFSLDNEALVKKNGHLQNQLELIQEKLRMELKEVEKMEKVRQGLVLEKETLGKKNAHLQNQLQLYEENLRTMELKHTDKLEKVRHGFSLDNEALVKKNGHLQNQLELIQEQLRTMGLKEDKWDMVRQGLIADKETLLKRNGQLQNQLDIFQEELRSMKLKEDKWDKLRHGLVADKEALLKTNGQLQNQFDVFQDELKSKDNQLHLTQEELRRKDNQLHHIQKELRSIEQEMLEKMRQVPAEKEALVQKNEQLQNQLDLLQEELKNYKISCVEHEKRMKELDRLSAENHVLAKDNRQLQKQFDIFQEDLRELRELKYRYVGRHTGAGGEKETLGETIRHLQKVLVEKEDKITSFKDSLHIQAEEYKRRLLEKDKEMRQHQYKLDLLQDEIVTKDSIIKMKEKGTHGLTGEKEALVKKNDHLTSQLKLIQEELRTEEKRWGEEKELLVQKNKRIQKQLDRLHDTLKTKETAFNNLSKKLSLQAKDLHNLANLQEFPSEEP